MKLSESGGCLVPFFGGGGGGGGEAVPVFN